MNTTDWVRVITYIVITLTTLDCARYLAPNKNSTDIQRAFFSLLCCTGLLGISLLLTLLSIRGLFLPHYTEHIRAWLSIPTAMVALTCVWIFYLFRIKK